MRPEHSRRLFILISFGMALTCLVANLVQGASLLHASFAALCVMLASALILLHMTRGMIRVLARFLRNEQKQVTG